MQCECGIQWRVAWLDRGSTKVEVVQSLEAAIFAASSIPAAWIEVYAPSEDTWLSVEAR